jgi:hypothetical protein
MENQKCSVYEHRPNICSTYGDPKYNACPYEGLSDDELVALVDKDPEKALALHKTAFTDPLTYGNDFIMPFVDSFMASDPEYMTWWEKLPKSNFVRK